MNASVAGTAEARADLDRLLGRSAAEAASLLRPHDRLGGRRRRCGPGSPDKGDRGPSPIGIDRSSGSVGVSHRPQCRAGLSAPPRPTGVRRTVDQDPDMIVDPATPTRDRQIAAASLRTFMRLPAAQRSSVILMDVLGYSLEEIGGVMDSSVPAVKAALNVQRSLDDRRCPSARARSIAPVALRADNRPAHSARPLAGEGRRHRIARRPVRNRVLTCPFRADGRRIRAL